MTSTAFVHRKSSALAACTLLVADARYQYFTHVEDCGREGEAGGHLLSEHTTDADFARGDLSTVDTAMEKISQSWWLSGCSCFGRRRCVQCRRWGRGVNDTLKSKEEVWVGSHDGSMIVLFRYEW